MALIAFAIQLFLDTSTTIVQTGVSAVPYARVLLSPTTVSLKAVAILRQQNVHAESSSGIL